MKNESLSFKSIPTLLNHKNLELLIRELIDNINNEIADDNFSQSDLISKSMAKSLSIKNGKKLLNQEQEFLVNSLFACKEPNISPFNKRTFVTISSEDLDKKFI